MDDILIYEMPSTYADSVGNLTESDKAIACVVAYMIFEYVSRHKTKSLLSPQN